MIRPGRCSAHDRGTRSRRAAAWLVTALLVAQATGAGAQTAATSTTPAGTALATQSGAVRLPSISGAFSTATSAAAATTTTATGGAATGGGPGAGGGSAAASAGTAAAAGSAASSAASGPAPAWLLCPPPGATGSAPFTVGTDLSCAP